MSSAHLKYSADLQNKIKDIDMANLWMCFSIYFNIPINKGPHVSDRHLKTPQH